MTRYVLTLVAVLLIAAVAFEAPQAVNAQGKGGGAGGGVILVLCEHIQSVAGNPTAAAIKLCGDLLFKTVFVTSTDQNGDLKTAGGGATGLEGADNICNLRAQEAGLAGTYTAWLSDTTADAKDRVTQSAVPYVRTDGVRVADNFGDLTDCFNPSCLQSAIDRDENKAISVSRPLATSTNEDGTRRTERTCVDWTSSSAAQTGWAGESLHTGLRWTRSGFVDCRGRSLRLYCFQD